eukprot:299906-Amphidinium_carterae.1
MNPDYERAIKTVEEYYRNVYIHNEQGDLNAFTTKAKENENTANEKGNKTTAATVDTAKGLAQSKRNVHEIKTIT